jgi:hypothetical protein
MGAAVCKADPTLPVNCNPTSLAAHARELNQGSLDGTPWISTSFERLHHAGCQQDTRDVLAITGEGHSAELIVRVEAAAWQGRVPYSAWDSAIEPACRSPGGDRAGSIKSHAPDGVMVVRSRLR